MPKKFLLSALTISLSTLLLSACGSSSDDSSETYAHVYNVSPNSTKLTLEFEKDDDGDDDTSDYIFSNIDFADASSTSEVENGTYEMILSGLDSNLEEEELLTSEVVFTKSKRSLVIVSGDYTDLQLQTFSYDIEDLNEDEDDDDNMRLYFADFITGSTGYEVRWSDSSDDFADATTLTSTTAGNVTLLGDFDTETYNFYVVDPANASTPLFVAEDVALTGETAYFLILRDAFGPAASGMALDKLTTSTTVVEYEDALGDAQYRVLNVAPETVDVSLSYSILSYEDTGIAQGTATDYTQVGYNDYAVTIKEGETELLSNLALSLPQNITKGVAIYQGYDEETDTMETKALAFEESVREIKYQTEVNFINLAYDVEQADVFFVAPGETMDTAVYDFQDVDFEELENGTLPTDEYRINVVLDLDDDNRIILNQTTLALDDDKNYTLILYKNEDENAAFDYSLLVAEQ